MSISRSSVYVHYIHRTHLEIGKGIDSLHFILLYVFVIFDNYFLFLYSWGYVLLTTYVAFVSGMGVCRRCRW